MQKTYFFLFVLGLAWTTAVSAQKTSGTYYAGAHSSLNIRSSPDTKSERLGQASYGEVVEILQPAADRSMVVDGISGGMAKVKHAGITGYMFDGYLLACPPPIKGEEVANYAGRLWEAEKDVLHEELRRDWGGYSQFTYALYFKDITWSDAFVIAKHLFGIPNLLQFPGEKGNGQVDFKNPTANPDAWTDELQTTYGPNGKLMKIAYVFRGEGSGHVISIEPTTEEGYSMKVSEVLIAD